MPEEDNNAYDELFVDDVEPQNIVLDSVKPFLRFTDKGDIVEQDDFYELNGKQQVLVLILGTKVLEAKDIRDQEGLRVAELVELTGMGESSVEGYVYGTLSDVVESDDGRIFVPNYRVRDAARELKVSKNE